MGNLAVHLNNQVQSLTKQTEDLTKKLAAERRRATDAEYMLRAIIPMLGEKGRQVVKAWEDKSVVRVHTDWVVDPMSMQGEEVAQIQLDMMKAADEAVPLTREELEKF